MNNIPELLVSLSGETIDTKEKWENFRRDEILSLLSEYIYGVRDIERPNEQTFTTIDDTEFMGMRKKEIRYNFNDFSFPFTLYLPKKIDNPVPVFIIALIESQEAKYSFNEIGNLIKEENPEVIRDGMQQIPIKDITDEGFGIAVMPTSNVYPDWRAHAEFKKGVFSSYKSNKERTGNSWGGVSAWSWGIDRVVDYLETDNSVDKNNIAVIGHSRGGKAALWAGATNDRIKLTVSNNSGCAGAAILRGNVGEHVKDINVSDWFCKNYQKYNDNEDMLPVDQHMLLSLIAPRYLYVTSSQDDLWADPNAEYLACRLASPAFELYGIKGLDSSYDCPPLESPILEGHIAYHMKRGDHSLGQYDWENIMQYFKKILKQSYKR